MTTEVNAHQASLRLPLNYVRLHYNFSRGKTMMQQKLPIPITLNIDFILWHKQLIVHCKYVQWKYSGSAFKKL